MLPKPRPGPRVEPNDPARKREHQGKSVIGDRLIVCPGGVKHQYAPFRCGVDVYHVEPDSELADGANIGDGIEESGVYDQVVSAKNQVDFF